VTIWLDAQLPPTLATWLTSTFGIPCAAIRDLGLRDADDRAIFQAARDCGDVVIISKDSDFTMKVARSALPLPLALWERAGVRETAMASSAFHGQGWR